jgi:DNA processing protein
MKVKELTLTSPDYPVKLQHIAGPPGTLFFQGNDINELLARPCVAVVGSRKVSPYGKAVTYDLVSALVQARIVIISGLALGVDSIAHRAALDAGGTTVAVLPTSIEHIYPAAHRALAHRIIEQGGALVTEYPPGSNTYASNFIARNRIVSACSDAVLITEAAARSGTLSTARFALEQGREVLAVPGNITSPTSVGTNNLIRAGATPITCAEDILHALGITANAQRQTPVSHNPHEQTLLTLIHQGTQNGAALLAASGLDVPLFNQTLTMLEIQGRIRPLGNDCWALI